MLNITADETRNLIEVRPQGAIPAADFETLARTIDDRAAASGQMPGLVIHLKGLPQWEGLQALRAHFDMIRKRAGRLPRVAVVTETLGLSMLPGIADIFTRARVRQFDVSDTVRALDWAATTEKRSEGYLLMEGFPDDVIAIDAVGEVTAADYEERLIPMVEERARAGKGKLRLLMRLGPDFEGYSAGAMWDDARLGLTHWRSFERVAIVSDIGWITRSIKLFAPLMPAEVAVFPTAAMEAARAWITAPARAAAAAEETASA